LPAAVSRFPRLFLRSHHACLHHPDQLQNSAFRIISTPVGAERGPHLLRPFHDPLSWGSGNPAPLDRHTPFFHVRFCKSRLTSTTRTIHTHPSTDPSRGKPALVCPSGGSMEWPGLPGTDQAAIQRITPVWTPCRFSGAFFRSQDFINNENRTDVLVTPYIVRACLPRKNCRVPMTDLRPHRIPNRHCWPRSTGSTAFPAARARWKLSGQFWFHHRLKAELPDQCGTRTKR